MDDKEDKPDEAKKPDQAEGPTTENVTENKENKENVTENKENVVTANIDDILPTDSASNVGTSVSGTSSARARAAARKASLLAKRRMFELQNKLDREMFELEQKSKVLKLESEIEAAAAEEHVLEQFELQKETLAANPLVTPTKTQAERDLEPTLPYQNGVGARLKQTTIIEHPEHSPYLHNVTKNDTYIAEGPSGLPPSSFNNFLTSTDKHKQRPAGTPYSMQTAGCSEVQKLVDVMSLPRGNLMKFDGDPMQYWTFVNAFNSAVDSTSVDDGAKLHRLLEYCTGRAAKAIKPCALMSPTEGYRRARELLKTRFGDEFIISQAWINMVTEGPPLKPYNGESLQDLADDVRGCVETLRAMRMIGEIDSRVRMVKILNRLPGYLQTRWRKEAVGTKDRTGQYPNVEHLATFLEKTSREANDPVFGCYPINPAKKDKNERPEGKKRAASYNLQAGEKTEKCHVCEGNHRLSQCDKLKNLPPEERLAKVQESRVCFNCLDWKNHPARLCRKPSNCDRDNCKRKHSRLLHDALEARWAMRRSNDENPNQHARDTSVAASHSKQSSQPKANSYACKGVSKDTTKIALPIVIVNVRAIGMKEFVRTAALLDPGSNKTFCSKSLVHRLGVDGKKASLAVQTLASEDNIDVLELDIELTGVGSQKKRNIVQVSKVCAVKEFPPFDDSIPSTTVHAWKHLTDILPRVQQVENYEVTLLIGQDAPEALIPLEVRRGELNEPYAVRTTLGWTLNGPLTPTGHSPTSVKDAVTAVCNFVHVDAESEIGLEAQVENFWKMDTEHSLAASQKQLSVEDRKVIDIWDSSVHFVDGHYELDIPFRNPEEVLPDNKKLAECRLAHLKRRFQRDPSMHKRYTEVMNDLLEKGYAEAVPEENLEVDGALTWYLPHHGVVNPNKPEKLRVVFDCAAKHAGVSLNNVVMQGPDMMNTLLGVLLRFRESPVAVMSDVTAMFHQVRVSPHHRDVLRFLWWRDGIMDEPPRVYRMTAHLFGGVWCPSCAIFALKQTAKDSGHSFDPATVSAVMENFYVDDCLKSFTSEDEAIKIVQELISLLESGGFRLTKWVSNSRKVIESIDNTERTQEIKSLDLDQDQLPIERALGISWDTEHDELGVRIKGQEGKLTKRGLLSITSSIYDPMGFVCPFVLQAKKLFQAECRLKKGWDDELEEENKRLWRNWLDELPLLEKFKLSRCLVPAYLQGSVTYQLHHFCDASELAYGTVSYLRIQSDGGVHCAFIIAKSKLAPVKQMTIPRLELSAAVLGVRVNSMLQREMRLELEQPVFWTDSLIVLQYIKNESKRFQTFVANRVALIHDGSSVDQWRYVDTASNPADDSSRGLNAGEMVSSDRWKEGPAFLTQDESTWPEIPKVVPELSETDKEVKRSVRSHAAMAKTETGSFDKLIDHYSSWYRLKKAVAWLSRFKSWLHARRSRDTMATEDLQVGELKAAETCIISYVQKIKYGKELKSLAQEGRLPRNSSLYNLEPYQDTEGLLRVQGRLKAARIMDQSKHPVIVPREHHVSELLVRHTHENVCGHSGREHVLSCIRQIYWIPKVRPLIDRVLKTCRTCKKLYGRPAGQRMADLVEDRVTPDRPPFTFVGVDCFGPFLVKRGRSQEKRYGCLFTCMTTRAIHIEKVSTMDANSFVNALTRFIARRGLPEKVRSDNGTNFVGGEKELRKSIQQMNQDVKVKEAFLHREIVWDFNPPAASHMGGAWERQIRSVRKILLAVLHEQVIDDERLDTVFCEVESIVNSRPITAASSDPNDLQPLTPNHLLLLRAGPAAPPGSFAKEDIHGRRWRHVQYLADIFWKRWIKEYLPTVLLRQKWISPQRNLVDGDMVLISDEATPRKCWPLGRVLRTFPGRDGLVRSAEVKTRWGTYTRPVSKLCFITD